MPVAESSVHKCHIPVIYYMFLSILQMSGLDINSHSGRGGSGGGMDLLNEIRSVVLINHIGILVFVHSPVC